MKKTIEICCGSYEDAKKACQIGADRIELNSALYLGGLTPSLGSLLKIKENLQLPVVCMLRDRGAGFHYNRYEIEVMLENGKLFLENGADGIVFGCLDRDGNIDVAINEKFAELAHAYHKVAVFHRAFDCVSNPYQSMKTLIDLKVDRVLTSGLKPTALLGKALIKDLIKQYGDSIEIIAGSGINKDNVETLIMDTDLKQVHASCKEINVDETTLNNKEVDFSYNEVSGGYEVVSKTLGLLFVEKIRSL